MPLPDPRSRARLAAMGIALWSRRPLPVVAGHGEASPPRIRLSSGDGDWLFVQRRPWDGQHGALLADITAVIGPARCRFGQWASGSDAGVALTELPGRGVRHVIAFGSLPIHAQSPGLIQSAGLDELGTSAEAKRALWRALCARLVG